MAKYVYNFGNGKADGDGSMKALLGGKGANLAENEPHWPAGASGIHDHDRKSARIITIIKSPIPKRFRPRRKPALPVSKRS
jgi:hypothetical protein